MEYKAIWLKEDRLMNCRSFDNFDDAKEAAEGLFTVHHDRFNVTAAVVEDAAGNRVHFYSGDRGE